MQSNNSYRHHCLPQYYLNQFGVKQKNGTYNIYIYNKNNGKRFTNAVSNIGYVKEYNTIMINGVKDDRFEKFHNSIYERKFSRIYYNIIAKIEKYFKDFECINCLSNNRLNELHQENCISDDEKYFLARMLAYFVIRNKKIRYAFEELADKLEIIYKDIYKVKKLDESKLEENLFSQIGNKCTRKNSYITLPFDNEISDKLTNIIFSHIWNVGYNNTDKLLYTCDNGYALDCLDKYPKSRSLAFGTYGNVIMFPLTPRICLLMYDSKFLKDNNINVINNNYVLLTSEIIETINGNIVYDGIDEIYSQDGNWENLDELIKARNLPLGHKSYKVT